MSLFDDEKKMVVKINHDIVPRAVVSFEVGDKEDTLLVDYPIVLTDPPEATRAKDQVEALRWLQGRTDDQFVKAWIALEIQLVERSGGTPERS